MRTVTSQLSQEARQFIADFEAHLRKYPQPPKPLPPSVQTTAKAARQDPLSPLTLALKKVHLI